MLHTADEVWVASSTREIVPITQVDGKAVGKGVPGKIWQRMNAAYQVFKQKVREGLA
jgi:D-alanine transaminase